METKRKLVVKVRRAETEKEKRHRVKIENALWLERNNAKYYNFVWPADIIEQLMIPEDISANEYILALIRNDIPGPV